MELVNCVLLDMCWQRKEKSRQYIFNILYGWHRRGLRKRRRSFKFRKCLPSRKTKSFTTETARLQKQTKLIVRLESKILPTCCNFPAEIVNPIGSGTPCHQATPIHLTVWFMSQQNCSSPWCSSSLLVVIAVERFEEHFEKTRKVSDERAKHVRQPQLPLVFCSQTAMESSLQHWLVVDEISYVRFRSLVIRNKIVSILYFPLQRVQM